MLSKPITQRCAEKAKYRQLLSEHIGRCVRMQRERNAQIESAVAEAMRNNLRRGFAQSVIAAIGDETTKANLVALIGAPASDLG